MHLATQLSIACRINSKLPSISTKRYKTRWCLASTRLCNLISDYQPSVFLLLCPICHGDRHSLSENVLHPFYVGVIPTGPHDSPQVLPLPRSLPPFLLPCRLLLTLPLDCHSIFAFLYNCTHTSSWMAVYLYYSSLECQRRQRFFPVLFIAICSVSKKCLKKYSVIVWMLVWWTKNKWVNEWIIKWIQQRTWVSKTKCLAVGRRNAKRRRGRKGIRGLQI